MVLILRLHVLFFTAWFPHGGIGSLRFSFYIDYTVRGHIQSRIQRMTGKNPHASSPSVTITSFSPSAFKSSSHSGNPTLNISTRSSAESGSHKASPISRKEHEESLDGRSSAGNEKRSAERGHAKNFFASNLGGGSNGIETDENGGNRAHSIASAGSKKGTRSSDSVASGTIPVLVSFDDGYGLV